MPDNDINYATPGLEDDNSTVYSIKQHDDDVIFSRDSLEEFIRLIQRQGINNLTIYSVSDLLAGNKYQTITTRFPPPHFEHKPLEFELKELKDRKGYFVFVRYSYSWEGGTELHFGMTESEGAGQEINGEYFSLNQLNGRHVFVKTVNDVHFYVKYKADGTIDTTDSSLFNEEISTQNPVPDIIEGNAPFMKNGTFTITIDNIQDVIKIKGFDDDGTYIGKVKRDPSTMTGDGKDVFLRGDGEWAKQLLGNFNANHIYPNENNKYDLGSSTLKWRNIYADKLIGTADMAEKDVNGNPLIGTYATGLKSINNTIHLISRTGPGDSDYVSLGTFTSSDTKNTAGSTNNTGKLFLIGASQQSAFQQTYSQSNVYMQSNILYATQVRNAVFNDYAEYRTTINLEAGRVVIDNDDGSLSCSSKRLQPGSQVISDTFGHSMGETDVCKTPLAVAGRVLVYTYQPRENYHAGMAVCSAPNGTVDIMTREEIKEYPDCIVGIVSEIPQYETWGTDNVKVNNRIWIKVK